MSDRSILDRFAFGPVAAVRPWLFAKVLYLILALDVWHTLVAPAWRYGAAGFNVAHFALLDALPMPTRQAYVGMLVIVGALAFVAAFLPRTPRALSIAIAVLYTWGWSCSMLDSYQHHYLLTVLLVTACLFPQHTARDLFGDEAGSRAPANPAKKKAPAAKLASLGPHGLVARVRSLAWALTTTFAGIVYAFTAVSKAEPDWRSGEALRNITQSGGTMPDVMALVDALGIDHATFFHAMGLQTIGIQVLCALAYLTATLRDSAMTPGERERLESAVRAAAAERTRITIAGAVSVMLALAVGTSFSWIGALVILALGIGLGMPRAFHVFAFAPLGRPSLLSVLASLSLVAALSFHAGAEYIGLQIGWFSYYMIALALVALTPAHWLAAAARVVTAPARTRESGPFDRIPVLAPVLGLAGAGAAAWAGVDIDLPGAYPAAVAVGLASLALGVATLLRPLERAAFGRACAALCIGMLACWASMTHGQERYDFYRFAGGDFRRRHEYQRALDDYREANRYAPPGESREDRVHEMEAAIRNAGGTPR
jgi:hypothetical protein